MVILVKPLALATFVYCELESMGSEDDDLTPFDTVVVEEEDGVVVKQEDNRKTTIRGRKKKTNEA